MTTGNGIATLDGKKGLIVGIANEHSLAWGCARLLHAAGAELAVTWLNDKARPFVEPLAQRVGASLMLPLDVEQDGQLETVFETITRQWGRLDFLLHAIAYAPKADLQGRVVDCSRAGFAQAMDVSCHSLIRMTHLAEPLMRDGGSVLTLSYLGGEEVVANYGLMGPVKAALESTVRYLAAELGTKNIRVNALSPGPVATRAASGIAHFDALLARTEQHAPLHRLVDLDDVGALCTFLVSEAARSITGDTLFVDAGTHILDGGAVICQRDAGAQSSPSLETSL